MRVEVILQLPFHHVGGQQQGQLAQFGEHARVAHGDVGRRVDHFDVVGFVQELLGDAGGGALPCEAFDGRLLLPDVLHVDGGDHGDPLAQNLLHILPAFRVAAARRIVECQLIDQADLGTAAENGLQIDGAIERGDDLQPGDDLADGAGDLILRGGDHHVLTAFLAAAPLVEHAQRLAHARRVSQEDLEPAPPFAPLLRLHAAQQFVGIGPAVGSGRHCV